MVQRLGNSILTLKRICVESAFSRSMGTIRDSDITMRKAGELGKLMEIQSKARKLKRLDCWSGVMLVHKASQSYAASQRLKNFIFHPGSPPKGHVAHL